MIKRILVSTASQRVYQHYILKEFKILAMTMVKNMQSQLHEQ